MWKIIKIFRALMALLILMPYLEYAQTIANSQENQSSHHTTLQAALRTEQTKLSIENKKKTKVQEKKSFEEIKEELLEKAQDFWFKWQDHIKLALIFVPFSLMAYFGENPEKPKYQQQEIPPHEDWAERSRKRFEDWKEHYRKQYANSQRGYEYWENYPEGEYRKTYMEEPAPGTFQKTYYQILGVGIKANPVEIKKAYYSLARKYHPDVLKSNPHAAQSLTVEQATEKFKEIQNAYSILSDYDLRQRYDKMHNIR